MTQETETGATRMTRFEIPGGLTLAAFVAYVVFNGSAPVAIRFTYAELPPFWAGGQRLATAAIVFWGLALARRVDIPSGRALWGAVAYGALALGVAPCLIFWGLVETPAGLYQTLMALIPLLTLLFAAVHGQERITRQGIFGSIVAVVGLIVAVGGMGGQAVSLTHVAAIVGAAICIAEAGVIAKGLPEIHPFAMNAVGLSVGGGMVLATSWIAGETWVIPTMTVTWVAVIYVFVTMAMLGLFLYLYVLRTWTASATSYVYILAPLVAVATAATLANEAITPVFAAGAIVVLAGVYVGALYGDPNRVECAPLESIESTVEPEHLQSASSLASQ